MQELATVMVCLMALILAGLFLMTLLAALIGVVLLLKVTVAFMTRRLFPYQRRAVESPLASEGESIRIDN